MEDRKRRQSGEESFLVRVQFTQNNTWQGTIEWLREEKSKPFRSALELMQLIEQAVGATETTHWLDKKE